MEFKKISINIRPDDKKALPLTKKIIGFMGDRGIECMLPEYDIIREERGLARHIALYNDFINSSDLAIVIGGDGSFLRTARMFSHKGMPIFGINRGRLGFLTEFLPEEAPRFLQSVLDGNYSVSERKLLEVIHMRLESEIGRMVFLNDAVISKGAISRPIKLYLEIDNQYLNSYMGDGIIIATATGSTAYSLSAGGPILFPSIKNVYIINPVCPHRMAIRPMIVPSSSILSARVVSGFENLLLTIDGQEAIPIEGDDSIIIHESDKMVKVITHPEHNYYEILSEKLGWGRNLEK